MNLSNFLFNWKISFPVEIAQKHFFGMLLTLRVLTSILLSLSSEPGTMLLLQETELLFLSKERGPFLPFFMSFICFTFFFFTTFLSCTLLSEARLLLHMGMLSSESEEESLQDRRLWKARLWLFHV